MPNGYVQCDVCEACFKSPTVPDHRFKGDLCSGADLGNLRHRLARVVVLYRAPDTMALYGLPYRMREGQSPRNIAERFRGDWVWLGSPGWWNRYSEREQGLIREFLATHADDIPDGPHEWSNISRIHGC
jgi:hypothetical protein